MSSIPINQKGKKKKKEVRQEGDVGIVWKISLSLWFIAGGFTSSPYVLDTTKISDNMN